MKAKIIEKSKELGFIDIGFAKVVELDDEIRHYKNWLDSGYNATMAWMSNNIEKRHNPKLILPEAKSVIVCLFNYFSGNHHSQDSFSKGKISRYAWNFDYHDIILPKLKELTEYLKSLDASAVSKPYVDTGPILEKVWAERAGVGWQAKNSLLISKEHGSYIFIGTILTSLEIEPESKIKDYCGTCHKCIDACPTDAIIADKIIDSNKCISYWTIEAKPNVEIPQEISQNSDNWVFGCDICQEVCPWNRHKPKITDNLDFHPRNGESELSYEYIANLTQEKFSERFRKSPVKRTKIAGLKRNLVMIKKNEI